jgi:hypothetical protein
MHEHEQQGTGPRPKGDSMRRRVEALTIAAVSLGALALALLGTATASAAVMSSNLVTNGGGEVGQAASDSTQVFAPTGWKTTGQFTAVLYGASGGFPGATVSTAINGGNAFFSGGTAGLSTATQTCSAPSSWSIWVKRGKVKAVLSADLGGYSSQGDQATVTATFLDKSGHKVKSFKVGPVTAADRSSQTTLLLRTATRSIPTATRRIKVVITSTGVNGTYDDGYADNVSLVLKR